MEETILVTGATGAVGRSLVSQLRSGGQRVRFITRNAEKADTPDAVLGDFTKGDLPESVFEGVRQTFLFPALSGVGPFVDQAAKCGVEHVVILSSLAASFEHERDRESPSALHHRAVEETAQRSGLRVTILRPGTFANNLLFWSDSIRRNDAVYNPYATSAQAPIHEDDIAAVAAAVFREETLWDSVYEMTGPECLTRARQLETIAEAIGRPLRYEEITPERFTAMMQEWIPMAIINMMLRYWEETIAQPDRVMTAFEKIIGRKALTLKQWAEDHKSAFTTHSSMSAP